MASLGFWPGLPFMMALDPRCKITAPKYNPPRTWTPQGTIGMGGASTAIYPVATPGGYQIFARTPAPIWDPGAALPGVLATRSACSAPATASSSCRSRSRSSKFYEAQVKAGTYVFNVNEYQKFSVRPYKHWLARIDPTTGSGEGRCSR